MYQDVSRFDYSVFQELDFQPDDVYRCIYQTCIFFPHDPPILVLCQVSLDMLAVLVPRIPSEAWMFQWKVGRNESNDRKRRKAYGQCLSRKRAEKGGNLLGECKMVTCRDMSR